jgi:hypothetical protein
MQWESLGFKDDPFKTQPITSSTLDLYTGNEEKLKQAKYALNSSNLVMVIEGDRGVGTTSFGNYLRFNAQEDEKYFTPTNEIKVEPYWNADTLLAAVIGNIIRTLELDYPAKVKKNKHFLEAKAIISKITKTFHSFGLNTFGIGGSYGASAYTSQPIIMPTQMLAHHIEDLVTVVQKLGFKYGMLIQLNNLDIGTVQNEKQLKILLNVMRDYFQTPGTSWLLVGDSELRRFIAQEVDRVDDIIAFDTEIKALSEKEYLKLIDKRIEYFKAKPQAKLPVDKDVWLYLFRITRGRLRYIFGLLNQLFSALQFGILTDKINLEIARPIIRKFGEDRIKRHKLSGIDEVVLKAVVANKAINVGELAKYVDKPQTQVSRVLTNLYKYKLVTYRQEWRNKIYMPAIDAELAYSEVEEN